MCTVATYRLATIQTRRAARWFLRERSGRIAIIGTILLLVMAGHWWTPTESHNWHGIHLILRKLFFVPVVLAAVWLDFRGTILTASIVTMAYLPYVFLQWSGQYGENINQVGELITVWITAALAGSLVGIERKALKEAAQTHQGALVALVGALDAREHDTQLHSLRVRAYALRLGWEIGMRDHDLTILGEAALLHDVGKIGVPDQILLKAGSLTEEEWELMREHPSVGHRILDPVEFLSEAAKIVYCHHEKFDGSGYPRGLKGEEIPFGARVFAVVDAFDALASDRPYQSEKTFAESKDIILSDSGRHFDPKVVQAFCSISEEEWEHVAQEVE